MNRAKTLLSRINRDSDFILASLVLALLLFALYLPTFKNMVARWNQDDFSYGYLMPFVVMYLIWERRAAITRIKLSGSWVGLFLIFLGIFIFWIGEIAAEYFTLYVSFLVTLIGIIWMFMGYRIVKELSVVWFFLFAMFPFPQPIYVKISVALQLISSKLGVLLLWAFGMSAYREGNVIDLGFTQLQVVEACSGLRYLLSLFILSVLIAYFYKDRLWKRALLVFSSIPISIVMNSGRIAITGILYEKFGSRVAEGFFHGFSGWLIFLTALGIMLLEIWILSRLGSKKVQDTKSGVEEKSLVSHVENVRMVSGFSLKSPHFIIVACVLVASWTLTLFVDFVEKAPLRKSLKEFPLVIDGWSGVPEEIEDRFLRRLRLDDYIHADYKDRSGKLVNFYVAYYETQKKGKIIHTPEVCLRGGGWEFEEQVVKTLKIGERIIPVNRAIIAMSEHKEVVYFAFIARGRVLTSNYKLRMYNFLDGISKKRTDGALIRFITPIYPDEGVSQAENRIIEFAGKVFPLLSDFIPN